MMKQAQQIITINIENIPCYCSIGIDDEEKKMGQELKIDVSFDIDPSNVISSDKLNDTVSYTDVFDTIQKVSKSKPYSLIEVLTENIASNLLQNPKILRVRVKTRKPHIPFPGFQGDVSVEIERMH